MSGEVAKRIKRVAQLIQEKVNQEVQNNLLHDELLMRACDVQQLADILLEQANTNNERL
jgi:hypothetical protein